MEKYNPQEIEKKWQKKWQKDGIYQNYNRQKKFYALDMFPYISGSGIHVGHPKGYIATDVFSRFKMLQGFSVLHPMGWDAFGLPAENYAIKNKINPNIFVKENIVRFKKQLEMFGFTYDWDREFSTTDPNYYKWTQWIFIKLFEKGLAYESNEPVNWCPSCKTVLANEDVEGGLCERCNTQVVQKRMRQWVLKMTDYADRLLYDLDSKNLDWEEQIKEQQRNWIGRSEGAIIKFPLVIMNEAKRSEESHNHSGSFANAQDDGFLEVFTTRLDTIYGCTYCVVAPENGLIANYKSQIINFDEVEKYLIAAQNKTELERMEMKDKSGVELKGIKAINPFTNEVVPIFIADYVLAHYGTGAVMAVPAHDERDLEFAKRYGLEINEVIKSSLGNSSIDKNAFIDDGILINSGKYNGLTSQEAREKMTQWLEKEGLGKKKINYKMRDWVFSRQRYWGEPIPIVHCEKCGAVAVPEKELPLKLPEVKNYEPTGTGEGPLAKISDWVNTICPKCSGQGKRETNTMPQWAGSSWYYLRYIDPKNDKTLIDKELEKKWMPVDLYVGGAEHATRHLLYARFWHKFLYDIKVVSAKEPFKRLVHVGLVDGEDGRKMSKRWGNVINPDDVINEFGVDSLRLYEMFMGPFSQNIAWSTDGVKGVRRFLEKVWKLQNKLTTDNLQPTTKLESLLHKTIKKVTEDIENFRFNTAISQMMILANKLEKEKSLAIKNWQLVILLLSPFAPHIAEELWHKLGHKESIFCEKWPAYNPKLIQDKEFSLVVQINGKVRDTIKLSIGATQEEAEKAARLNEKIKKYLTGTVIVKKIYIPNKLLNIVIK